MAGILIFVAGIGFGIAQAGGTRTDRAAYGIGGHESLQVVNAPEEDMDEAPLFVANAPEEDMDGTPLFVTNAPEEDLYLAGPIGVGTLPSGSDTAVDDIDSRDQGEYSMEIDDVDGRDQGEWIRKR